MSFKRPTTEAYLHICAIEVMLLSQKIYVKVGNLFVSDFPIKETKLERRRPRIKLLLQVTVNIKFVFNFSVL